MLELAAALNPEFATQLRDIVQVLVDDELLHYVDPAAQNTETVVELTQLGHIVAQHIESRAVAEASTSPEPRRVGRRASYQVLAGAD